MEIVLHNNHKLILLSLNQCRLLRFQNIQTLHLLNMITPPQTPGIKSPTKANFSFPPNSNGSTDCNDQQNPQQMPPKVKRKRITQEQLQDLVAMFEQTDTPSYDVREKLAKKLNMTN